MQTNPVTRLLLLLAFWVGGVYAFAGTAVRQERPVALFTSVWISDEIEVELQQGSVTRVVVEGQNSDLPTIQTQVIDGMLRVAKSPRAVPSGRRIKVFIQTPHLTHLLVNESARVSSRNTFREESLYIDLGGSATVALSLHVGYVSVQMSGTAQLSLKGKSSKTRIVGAGTSVATTAQLKSDQVVVRLRHRTKLDTHAEQSIDAQLYDQVNLRYHGAPANKRIIRQGTPLVEEVI